MVDIDIIEHAVLRSAAWPIETATEFAAPALAAAARALLAHNRRILDRQHSVLAALHAAVPTATHRETRRYLLDVKRRVFAGSDLMAEPSLSVDQHLRTLPCGALLASEMADRKALAERREQFKLLYAEEMRRQRETLHSFVTQPKFRKAIALVNPPFAVRLAKLGALLAENQRRRLETTALDYLMRAAGRATPCAAWAGVAPVEPDPEHDVGGPGLRIEAAPAKYAVALSLKPFEMMLRVLSLKPHYLIRSQLRLNPRIGASKTGHDYHGPFGGDCSGEQLRRHPLHQAIMGYYEDGQPRSAEPLIEAICTPSAKHSHLREIVVRCLHDLVHAQILLPVAALPALLEDTWKELGRAASFLLEPERMAWVQSLDRLRSICDNLGREFDELAVEDVVHRCQTVESVVQALWTDTGLDGAPPGPVVQLDLRVPIRAFWSAATRRKVQAAIRQLLGFHSADGGAELYRKLAIQEVFNACDPNQECDLLGVLATGKVRCTPPPATLHGKDMTPGTAPDTRRGLFSHFTWITDDDRRAVINQCQRWENLLAPVCQQSVFELPWPPPPPGDMCGPGGAILLAVTAEAPTWLGNGRPQPALFASRFTSLLREQGEDEARFFSALRAHYVSRALAGVTAVEVAGRDAPSLNAAVRPSLCPASIEPHGAFSYGPQGVRICFDEQQRPWLRGPQAPGLLLPVYNSAAAIGQVDPTSRLLWMLAMGHGWEFMSLEFPALAAERDCWRHLPRLHFPDGAIFTRERWTVDGETVTGLVRAAGAQRYLMWLEYVDRVKLPSLVHVRCGLAYAEVLLQTDSPLAIECLMEKLASRARWLIFTELPGDWRHWPVQDHDGRHYLAELAVTWYAENYYAHAPKNSS